MILDAAEEDDSNHALPMDYNFRSQDIVPDAGPSIVCKVGCFIDRYGFLFAIGINLGHLRSVESVKIILEAC